MSIEPSCPLVEALTRLVTYDIIICEEDKEIVVCLEQRQTGEYYKREDVINLLNEHGYSCNFKGVTNE